MTRSSDGPGTPEKLLPLVYAELRRLAGSYMRRERPDHTLQPTALVHEAYLRLIRNTQMTWRDKTHVLAMAAIEMRRILVDHARKKRAEIRGGGWTRVSLSGAAGAADEGMADVLEIDLALGKLAEHDERQGTIAVLKIFGGLETKEMAEYLGVSERTVRGDWHEAKGWLRDALKR